MFMQPALRSLRPALSAKKRGATTMAMNFMIYVLA